jgi:hypothetical protein
VGGVSHKSKKDQNYYVNEKEAKAIARRIFDHYDRDRSGVIGKFPYSKPEHIESCSKREFWFGNSNAQFKNPHDRPP